MTTATTPTITVGWRLRMARERVGMQQRELAARIGVHHNTVGNYERDKGAKKLEVLTKWADATGVDLAWIVGDGVTHGYPVEAQSPLVGGRGGTAVLDYVAIDVPCFC